MIAPHWTARPSDERFAAVLGKDVARSIGELEASPTAIDSVFKDSVQYMQARFLVDPSAALSVTWESVAAAMQVGSTMFAITSRTEGTVECRIDHELRRVPAIGPRTYPDASDWLTAFWLAIVCRDQDRMTQLPKFPLDQLRSATGQTEEFVYLWVDTLQTYWLRKPGVAEKLMATIDASYPGVATQMPRDLLEQIIYQPINLFLSPCHR